MTRSSSSSSEADWDANRRKHERVRGESLPHGEYEDAYTWDTKGSVHARNRNERAAQEFSTIYGDTRPGDDWEYAGQQAGLSWRGKDGSGDSTPAVGIWKRKAPAPAAAAQQSALAATTQAPPQPAPAAPAATFNLQAYAATQQPTTGGTATGGTTTDEIPSGYAAIAKARIPGRTISREGFDITPNYYNAWVAGKAEEFDQRQSDEDDTSQMRFAGSQRFRQRLQERIAAAQQLTA